MLLNILCISASQLVLPTVGLYHYHFLKSVVLVASWIFKRKRKLFVPLMFLLITPHIPLFYNSTKEILIFFSHITLGILLLHSHPVFCDLRIISLCSIFFSSCYQVTMLIDYVIIILMVY